MRKTAFTDDALWDLGEVGRALEVTSDAPTTDIRGVSIDSRTLNPGDLFVALDGSTGTQLRASQGAGHDGHDFVEHAASKGAAAAMVHAPLNASIPLIKVDNTREGLWQLGIAARARMTGVVFAITGSAGKTTAKSMLAALTGGFATEGSLNNVWGVPLSLARTPRDALAGVYEIGMNAPGEIAPLSRLVAPQVALVLNALPAHLKQLGSIDAVRREKLSIFEGLESGGTLVLPDTMNTDLVPREVNQFRFGRSAQADLVYSPLDETWQAIEVRCAGKQIHTSVPGGGEHRAQTVAAVAACAIAGGYSLTCVEQLSEVELPVGRGRETLVGDITVIDDSYNANPVSMAYAIEQFAKRPGRRLALLGEMLELGESEAKSHVELGMQAGSLVDGAWCVGQAARATHDTLPASIRLGWHTSASDALMDSLLETLQAGDCLLIKGSNKVFWTRGFARALVQRLASG